jgi:hypothetical protein
MSEAVHLFRFEPAWHERHQTLSLYVANYASVSLYGRILVHFFVLEKGDIKTCLRFCTLTVIFCPNNTYFADLCVAVRGYRCCLKLLTLSGTKKLRFSEPFSLPGHASLEAESGPSANCMHVVLCVGLELNNLGRQSNC